MSVEVVRELATRLSVQHDKASYEKAQHSIESIKEKLGELAGASGVGGVIGQFKSLSGVMGGISLTSFFKGPLGLAVGFAGAAAAMAEMGNKVAKTAGEVRRGALMTGMGVEGFQEWSFAAKESGVSAETFQRSAGRLAKTLESGHADASLQKLTKGLKDSQGHLLPTEEVMGILADRIKAMPEGFGKVYAAQQLFGRGGAEMLPLLNKGSEGFKEYAKEAHEFGIVLGGDTLKAAKEFSQSKKTISAVFEGLEMQIGSVALPMMADAMKALSLWIKENRTLIQSKVSGFLQEMISGFKLLGMVIGPVLNAGESLKKMFDGFGEGGATKGVNILGDALKALLSPVTSIFEGLDDIGRWLSGKASGLGYIFAKDQNAYLAAAKRGAKFTLGGEEEKRLPNGDKNFHGVNATSYWKDVKSVATSRAWDVRSAIAPAGAEWDLTPEGQQRSSWGTSAFRVPLQHPTGDMVMSHADQALASYAPSLPPSQSTYAPEVTSTINLTVNGTGPVDAEQISKQVGEEVDTRLANLMRDSGELVQ